MGYVNSSPWQDAANFGGAVGDRLTQAFIDLPLKKAAMTQQMLQAALALKQQQFQNNVETQKLGLEKGHYQAEATHYQNEDKNMGNALDLKKNQQKQNDLFKAQKMGLDTQKATEQKREHIVSEGLQKQKIQLAHDKLMQQAQVDKSQHPEFGGSTLAQMIAYHADPIKWSQQDPQVQKNFLSYLQQQLQESSQQQQQQQSSGIGSALQPKPQGQKTLKYDPATGQIQ